jgi:hypothetical protein
VQEYERLIGWKGGCGLESRKKWRKGEGIPSDLGPGKDIWHELVVDGELVSGEG